MGVFANAVAAAGAAHELERTAGQAVSAPRGLTAPRFGAACPRTRSLRSLIQRGHNRRVFARRSPRSRGNGLPGGSLELVRGTGCGNRIGEYLVFLPSRRAFLAAVGSLLAPKVVGFFAARAYLGDFLSECMVRVEPFLRECTLLDGGLNGAPRFVVV